MMISAASTPWDSFVPDLIVGVMTGTVVGLFLLLAQNIVESRKQRFAAEIGWEGLKPKIRSAVHRSWSTNLDDLLPPPVALSAVHEAIEGQPLHAWSKAMKKPDPMIDMVHAFMRVRSTYENEATGLEAAMELHGLKIASSTGIPLPAIKRVLRARAYGDAAEDDVLLTLEADPQSRHRLLRAVNQLSAVEAVTSAFVQYVETVALYRESLSRLRELTTASS
ncbi:hypothetical protein SCB71_15500 [Herbiconiux sp. KACC 21604]|uniref:hypothetical protein n=1 Tax=unclassified Herbiconiux TaxID=2618217 RepID=UPI001490E448|nr:hypothetical protein [Herbiconiux sp. SALV-R1]QJU54532.1 hypothetical protein HL652_13445 [Herbiconiux sp. SALV-R1]WPO85615.1 hypothetical protein SCB71_15500 [Herbiconiux sp. KACC 21604]